MIRPAFSKSGQEMTQSPEVQLAVMQEQLRTLIEGATEARQSRKDTFGKLDEMSRDLTQMRVRLDSVEKTLAGHSPTIQEFVKIKHQVSGAGLAGKWLWGAGGMLIGLAFASREFIRKWLME